MVKREDKHIYKLQHKKFQGVYDPNIDKNVLLDLLKTIFDRFTITLTSVWSEPDQTRPGKWHTHFLIVAKGTMTLKKDETLNISGTEPSLLRIEDDNHLKFLINYSLKSDKNVMYYPSIYPYPIEYMEPRFLRKITDYNTTPESLADLSTSIREGVTDILKDCGSLSKIKAVIKLFAKGEPIMLSDPPPNTKLRPWHESYKIFNEKKEVCRDEEDAVNADPLSRYVIVFSPLSSQGFNFLMNYYEKHISGTAVIKLDTEDSMALQIYSIYLRNGLKPIRNIMMRIDDTTIIKSDHDAAMANFLNRMIIAKTRGGAVKVPTTSNVDITIFTHNYVPEKYWKYHDKRLRYITLDRFYSFHEDFPVMTASHIYAKYGGYQKLQETLLKI